MPELPETETIKNGILTFLTQITSKEIANNEVVNNEIASSKISGNTITDVIIRTPKLRYPISENLKEQLINKKIITVTRRARYVILQLDCGYLLFHFGMSGSLLLTDQNQLLKKHDHVDIILNKHIIRYNDPRRFGLISYELDLTNCTLLNKLGVEPLNHEFNPDYLFNITQKRNTGIKQIIMDNAIVVGVGNIYATEALYLSRINPFTRALELTHFEIVSLVKHIKAILQEAIDKGGSSLKDYKKTDGTMGYFQNQHYIYGKKNQSCPQCNGIIISKKQGSRSSFYCEICQPLKP